MSNFWDGSSFGVFILTHGRPDKVKTYHTLRKQGYTGPIYVVIDNEDKQADRYYANFNGLEGVEVVMFDKLAVAESHTHCEMDNFDERRSVLYARLAIFDIAKQVGLEYFLMLDDDYASFDNRFNQYLEYEFSYIKNLDAVFNIILDYYKSIPATSIAIAQGGDYSGGAEASQAKSIVTRRKLMNTFFCATDRPFKFIGKLNDDVNTYVALGNRGHLFLTTLQISIIQVETQQQGGGLTDIYLAYGTYIKSFTTVMLAPSCVKVGVVGDHQQRIHHDINWNRAVPKIISEQWRKNETQGL